MAPPPQAVNEDPSTNQVPARSRQGAASFRGNTRLHQLARTRADPPL